MVSKRDPCMTPSQVWMPSLDLTGIVPSPDSILVLNCPLAFLLGCLSVAPVKALLVKLPSGAMGVVNTALYIKM